MNDQNNKSLAPVAVISLAGLKPLDIVKAFAQVRSFDELEELIGNALGQEFDGCTFTIYKYLHDRNCFKNIFTGGRNGANRSAAFTDRILLAGTRSYNSTDESIHFSGGNLEALDVRLADHLTDHSGETLADRTKMIFDLISGEQLSGILMVAVDPAITGQLSAFLLDQITLALNKLDNVEQVKQQKKERELLLSLSTSIAKVRDQSQLQDILSTGLKNFLGFSHLAVALYNDTKKVYNLFMLDPESRSKGHPDYAHLQEKDFEMNDPFTKGISTSDQPVSYDLEKFDRERLPLYLRVNKDSGIRQFVGLRFMDEDRPLGILGLFFEERLTLSDENKGLLISVGHQIAVAISSILAGREVDRLLMFKNTMLKQGIELRLTRDVTVLSNTIRKLIYEIYQVREYVVTIIDEERSTHSVFFNYQDPEQKNRSRTTTDAGVEITLQEDVYQEILMSPYPIRIQPEAFQRTVLSSLLTPLPDEAVIGSVIRLGEKPIALIVFNCPNPQRIRADKQIFDSLCSQIGFVIINILAHQKLENQLLETDRYRRQLEVEKNYLSEELNTQHNHSELVGESESLREVFQLVKQVSRSSSTVLILGETGTGKELIARAIHNNSARQEKLMIKVNCAAIPANLIESELFGHEKGSFTGATERRIGKFELANGGTLFLDEIGEMPIDLQVKLLRALQEKEIERVGGKSTITVDVRIVAATNRNLEEEMAAGRFRRDLYYRLNIFPIPLPPLRDRKEDIECLAIHFLEKHSKRCGKSGLSIGQKALQDLKRYNWPGNIRELEHLIERSILLAETNVIKQVPLPETSLDNKNKAEMEERLILRSIDENEREHILKVLNYCSGRIAGTGNAAEILGVPPTTLNSKMKRLGIKRAHTS